MTTELSEPRPTLVRGSLRMNSPPLRGPAVTTSLGPSARGRALLLS